MADEEEALRSVCIPLLFLLLVGAATGVKLRRTVFAIAAPLAYAIIALRVGAAQIAVIG